MDKGLWVLMRNRRDLTIERVEEMRDVMTPTRRRGAARRALLETVGLDLSLEEKYSAAVSPEAKVEACDRVVSAAGVAALERYESLLRLSQYGGIGVSA
jgi:hypothetical protein